MPTITTLTPIPQPYVGATVLFSITSGRRGALRPAVVTSVHPHANETIHRVNLRWLPDADNDGVQADPWSASVPHSDASPPKPGTWQWPPPPPTP